MQNISSSAELKNAILLLEVEQTSKRELLKAQLNITYESLRPVNIIRKTLSDIALSLKKIFIGTSGNFFRKLLGSVLQFGITTVVSQHPDVIKSLGKLILQYFLRKRETNSGESGR